MNMNLFHDTPTSPPLRRWKIYTGQRGRDFLCIVAARTREAAMKTARSMFHLNRAAYAVQETRSEMEFSARRLSYNPNPANR
jgi:hypothetical protein